MKRGGFQKKSAQSPSFERPLKLLVQLLAISTLVAIGNEKIHCAVGMETSGVLLLVATALKASLRTFQQLGAICASLKKEKLQHSGLKCSLRHWQLGSQLQTTAYEMAWKGSPQDEGRTKLADLRAYSFIKKIFFSVDTIITQIHLDGQYL